MKKDLILIAHYVGSTATILTFNKIEDAFCNFNECKLHPDLSFAILYAKSGTRTDYMVIDSYVNQDQRHAFELVLLGFNKSKTPAGQEIV